MGGTIGELKEIFLKNESLNEQFRDHFENKSIYWLVFCLFCLITWLFYITLYNSRVIGLLITYIVGRFTKTVYFSVGSLSISVLSGKIMFRDFVYISDDMSFRCIDGIIIFKYWRLYWPFDDLQNTRSGSQRHQILKSDASASGSVVEKEKRLLFFLNGVDFHWYNRSDVYSELARLFGIDVPYSGKDETSYLTQDNVDDGSLDGIPNDQTVPLQTDPIDESKARYGWMSWRDLLPIIKIEIEHGKFSFGNDYTPTMICITYEKAFVSYMTQDASSPEDLFMHYIESKWENFMVSFVSTKNYKGLVPQVEPPRNMGFGFTVVKCGSLEIRYEADEAGLQPNEAGPVLTWPVWKFKIRALKPCEFCYGPWADRQREYLWQLFAPPRYGTMSVDTPPAPGQRRFVRALEISMHTESTTRFEVLFTKENKLTCAREILALNVEAAPGCCFDATIPWQVEADGYTSEIKLNLMKPSVSTHPLTFTMVNANFLLVEVFASYPRCFNQHQTWNYRFNADKAVVALMYEHKNFFKSLIEDWAGSGYPNLFHFVAFTYNIKLNIDDFELHTLVNDYNWIDTASQSPENAKIALCGKKLDVGVVLPYTEFLPTRVPIELAIRGRDVVARLQLPQVSTTCHTLHRLASNARMVNRQHQVMDTSSANPIDRTWVDCWISPEIVLQLNYTYHPMPAANRLERFLPPKSASMLAKLRKRRQLSANAEENALEACRPPQVVLDKAEEAMIRSELDSAELEPDLVELRLEVPYSTVFLYGSLIRHFLHLKENYLGMFQEPVEFDRRIDESVDKSRKRPGWRLSSNVGIGTPLLSERRDSAGTKSNQFELDAREYRPFAVKVFLSLHNIQGHLMSHCAPNDNTYCPTVHVNCISFELDKHFTETRLQVVISPLIVYVWDNYEDRGESNRHLSQGHLTLSGLQVRGDAFFSHKGLPIESETLEYGWLVEVIVGRVAGRLTAPQLATLVQCLQTFVFMVEDAENELISSRADKTCVHGQKTRSCPRRSGTEPCLVEEDLKYAFTRVSVDTVDLHFAEHGTDLNVKLSPLRLSTCNLHSACSSKGISALLPQLHITHYVFAGSEPEHNLWLEVGSLQLGPLTVNTGIALPRATLHAAQDNFLKLHDAQSRRLWFLWSDLEPPSWHCGCMGGCAFFGLNASGKHFFNEAAAGEVGQRFMLMLLDGKENFGCCQSLLNTSGFTFQLHDPQCCYQVRLFNKEALAAAADLDLEVVPAVQPEPQPPPPPPRALLRLSNCSASDITLREDRGAGSFVARPLSMSRSSECSTLKAYDVDADDDLIASILGRDGSIYRLSSSSDTVPSDMIPAYIPPHDDAAFFNFNSRPTSYLSSFSSATYHTARSAATARSKSGVSAAGGVCEDRSQSRASVLSYFSDTASFVTAASDMEEDRDTLVDSRRHSLAGSRVSRQSIFEEDNDMDMDMDRFQDATFDFDDIESTVLNQTAFDRSAYNLRKNQLTELPSSSSSSSLESNLYQDSLISRSDRDSWHSSELGETKVNLREQLQRCITDSEFILGAYRLHLSQFRVTRWESTPPDFCRLQFDAPLDQGVPHFHCHQEGFHSRLLMSDANDEANVRFGADNRNASKLNEATEAKTTAVIQLRNRVDLLITPLFLEGIQRYIEALTPALANANPSTILDNLHFNCVHSVIAWNKMKKTKHLRDLGAAAAKSNSTDLDEKDGGGAAAADLLTHSTRTDFIVLLPKVNLNLIQISNVEDHVSVSEFMNRGAVTCVSLLAFSIDTVSFQALLKYNMRRDCMSNAGGMSTGHVHANASADHNNQPHVVLNSDADFVEENTEEIVCNLKIDRIHCQLRRLTRDSNFTESVTLTAIPQPKVFFGFESDRERINQHSDLNKRLDERAAGWIMFECGLEKLSLSAMRKMGFEEHPDAYEDVATPGGGGGGTAEDTMFSDPPSESAAGFSVYDDEDNTSLNKNFFNSRLDVHTVWMRFAAPPRLPNKRRIDLNCRDWNLLSTATPTVRAWMNPIDRLVMATKSVKCQAENRILAVMAGLMTEAVDYITPTALQTSISVCIPHRGKHYHAMRSSLARALVDDHSCLTFSALRIFLSSVKDEKNLLESLQSNTPSPEFLQKGILAMTRQWKRLILEDSHFENWCSSKPSNWDPNVFPLLTNMLDTDEPLESLDGFNGIGGTVGSRPSSILLLDNDTDPYSNMQGRLPHFASADELLIGGASVEPLLLQSPQPRLNRSESGRLYDNDALYDICLRHDSSAQQKQQQQQQQQQQKQQQMVNYNMANFAHRARELSDCPVYFRALLEAVGLHVKGIRRTTLMKKFGGMFAADGFLKQFRIDIVESESNPLANLPTFPLPAQPQHKRQGSAETTFLCEKFASQLTLRDVVDSNYTKSARYKDEPGGCAGGGGATKLDIKPTTTQVSFSFHIDCLRQTVNMPLLRLVHQFVTMIYHIHDTREEIEVAHSTMDHMTFYRTHRKQDSGSMSIATDTTHSTTRSKMREDLGSTVTATPAVVVAAVPCSSAASTPLINRSAGNTTPVLQPHSKLKRPASLRLRHSPGKHVRSNTADKQLRFPGEAVELPLSTSNEVKMESAAPSKLWKKLALYIDIYMNIHSKGETVIVRPALPDIAEEVGLVDAERGVFNSGGRLRESFRRRRQSQLGGISSAAATTGNSRRLNMVQRDINWLLVERCPIVIFGTMKIVTVRMVAVLSGLKLNSDIQNVHSSVAVATKIRGQGKWSEKRSESSVSAHVSESKINLTEQMVGQSKAKPVVNLVVGGSHALVSLMTKETRRTLSERTSAFISVGKVSIQIPHHPVVLHDMMQRQGRRLTTQLQDIFQRPMPHLRGLTRPNARRLDTSISGSISGINTAANVNPMGGWVPGPGGGSGRGSGSSAGGGSACQSSAEVPTPGVTNGNGMQAGNMGARAPSNALKTKNTSAGLNLVFKGTLRGLTVTASLMSTLEACYEVKPIQVRGRLGDVVRFEVALPESSLGFKSPKTVGSNILPSLNVLPSAVSVAFPRGMFEATYRPSAAEAKFAVTDDHLTQGLATVEGGFLDARAKVEVFKLALTTDHLNYLTVVVKAFMKEINEVIQKMAAGDDQLIQSSEQPIVSVDQIVEQHPSRKNLLFSLTGVFDGLRISATTPSHSEIKLETDPFCLELSNRVQQVRICSPDSATAAATSELGGASIWKQQNRKEAAAAAVSSDETSKASNKLFLKANTSINVELGYSKKNLIYAEANPEFTRLAFFKTRVGLRNSLVEELLEDSSDQEAWLITLEQPMLHLGQPDAMDKAAMLVFQYRSAYEMWINEMELAETVAVVHTRRASNFGLPINFASSISPASNTALYLQLTVNNLGISLPIPTADEARGALLLTLDSSQISACSKGPVVSKGRFSGFCLRFEEDFSAFSDDWRPSLAQNTVVVDAREHLVLFNACVVPSGSFEVCWQTHHSLAKMVAQVDWQMYGLDIHLDRFIGKRLKALFSTLTSMAGFPVDEAQDEADDISSHDNTLDFVSEERETDLLDNKMVTNAGLIGTTQMTRRSGLSSVLLLDRSKDTRSQVLELEELVNNAYALRDRLLASPNFDPQAVQRQERLCQELETRVTQIMRQTATQNLRRRKNNPSLRDRLGLGLKRSSGALTEVHDRTSRHSHQRPSLLRLSSNLSARFKNVHDIMEDDATSSGAGSPVVAPFSQTIDVMTRDQIHFRNALNSGGMSPGIAADDPLEVEMRRVPRVLPSQTTQSASSMGPPNFTAQQQINMELQVKIHVDSGKCVLHPPVQDAEDIQRHPFYTHVDCNAPNKKHRTPRDALLHRYRQALQNPRETPVITRFFIPALDVELTYNSKTELATSESALRKRADLYARVVLDSLPRETVISPSLLDFLEKAVEANPTGLQMFDTLKEVDEDASSCSSLNSVQNISFPVDVVVYVKVLPSVIRLTCQPKSNELCIMQLPSLDLVFTTKRATTETDLSGSSFLSESWPDRSSGSPTPSATSNSASSNTVTGTWSTSFPMQRLLSSNNKTGSSGKLRRTNGRSVQAVQAEGGLSVTGCLSKFSFFIINPWQRVCNASHLDFHFDPAASDMDLERILEFNVEYVRVDLTRSRRAVVSADRSAPDQVRLNNMIQFSTICDIGKAKLKHSLRLFSSVLNIPKAWYRSALTRRLFLGDEEYDIVPSQPPQAAVPQHQPYVAHHKRESSGDKYKFRLDLKSLVGIGSGAVSNLTKQRSSMPGTPDSPMVSPRFARKVGNYGGGISQVAAAATNDSRSSSAGRSSFESTILFSVRLTELVFDLAISGTLGHALWTTRGIKTHGRLSMDSAANKDWRILATVDSSNLVNNGNTMQADVACRQLVVWFQVSEKNTDMPQHGAGARIDAIEARLYHMTDNIFFFRASTFRLRLADEWCLNPQLSQRPLELFVAVNVSYDQVHVMVHKRTLPELLLVWAKLRTQFEEQVHRQVLRYVMETRSAEPLSMTGAGGNGGGVVDSSSSTESLHHRHWQTPMRLLQTALLRLQKLDPAERRRPCIGGRLTLFGRNFTIAGFDGGFSADAWFVFLLLNTSLAFESEAQEAISNERQADSNLMESPSLIGAAASELGLTISQDLRLKFEADKDIHQSSFIAKVTYVRDRHDKMASFNKGIRDWFDYALRSVAEEEMARFPSLESSGAGARAPSDSIRKRIGRQQSQKLFWLPHIDLHVVTLHSQDAAAPRIGVDVRPEVLCTFSCESVGGPIVVPYTVEPYYSLRAFIMTYQNENAAAMQNLRGNESTSQEANDPTSSAAALSERDAIPGSLDASGADAGATFSTANGTTSSTTAESATKEALSGDLSKEESYNLAHKMHDYREFITTLYKTNIQIRTQNFETANFRALDNVLNSEFMIKNQRVTVPKKLQRFLMDPMDATLAQVVEKAIKIMQETASDAHERLT